MDIEIVNYATSKTSLCVEGRTDDTDQFVSSHIKILLDSYIRTEDLLLFVFVPAIEIGRENAKKHKNHKTSKR